MIYVYMYGTKVPLDYIVPLSLSVEENRAGMLHIAAIPTMPYTILDSRLPLPNIKATRSKFKRPISPQLSPPTISRAMQSLYIIYVISFQF